MSQGSQEQPAESSDTPVEDSITTGLPFLKAQVTNIEIVEAFKNQINGISIIHMPQVLPHYTFVTADAVTWLLAHVEGVSTIPDGLQILKNLHKENLIRHASGDTSKPLVYGFCLFYIVTERAEDSFQPSGELETFENDFLEVEVMPALNWGKAEAPGALKITATASDQDLGVPHFLCQDIDEYSEMDTDTIMYKRMRLETDVANKSERTEWGHAQYQTLFRPDRAYELVVEWLTSSGSIIADLLLGWHRKAQSCNLQMIPIPHDPLALPYSNKSDPLRGPIFIPLNVSCLNMHDNPFKDFHESTWTERMFLFQEGIAQRFGFIKCMAELPSAQTTSSEYQYIHATGTIFILISNSAPRSNRSRANSLKERPQRTKRYSAHADVVPSPHEAYITRHVSGKNKADYDNSRKMGFLWCWNHMISRRWRTNQGVDNNFQIKCLQDFKAFCNNSGDRLRAFWRESWEAKEMAESMN